MSPARDMAFVLLQHLLPQHTLSRLTGALASSRLTFLKNWLITRFIAAFGVDMREAAEPAGQKLPRPQLRADDVRGGQKWPAGHCEHEVDAIDEAKVPAGQPAQGYTGQFRDSPQYLNAPQHGSP